MKVPTTTAEYVAQESEASLQAQVIEYAQLRGWLVMHSRPAQTGKGWRTPIAGDKGFPDLVLVRSGYLVFAELKNADGECSSGQQVWLRALTGYTAVEWPSLERALRGHGADIGGIRRVCLWRPSDFPQIIEVLR